MYLPCFFYFIASIDVYIYLSDDHPANFNLNSGLTLLQNIKQDRRSENAPENIEGLFEPPTLPTRRPCKILHICNVLEKPNTVLFFSE